MKEQAYRVATCGLSARDERVVGIILSRVTSLRFRYVAAPSAMECDIALLEPQNPQSAQQLRQLREHNPQLVALSLIDGLPPPGARHLVSRRTLWSHMIATLDDIVGNELALRRAPARDAPAIAAEPPVEQAPPLAAARLRALVLDDSVIVRTQLDAALRKLGISFDGAADWDSAADLLQRNSYDFMLLDIVMPTIDGYEACRRVRRNPATKRLPVLMLTSRSSAFDRARGALAGCDMYLIKPIDLSAFHAAVNKIVARLCHNDLRQARQRGFIPAIAWPSS